MRELEVYEAGLHACGYHRDLIDDESNVWAPEARTCQVCQGIAHYGQILRKEDEEHRKNAPEDAPDPSYGRGVYMRLMGPAEAEAWRMRQARD